VEAGDEAILEHHLVLRVGAHRDGASVQPDPLDRAAGSAPAQDQRHRFRGLDPAMGGDPFARRVGNELQGAGGLGHGHLRTGTDR